VHSTPEFPPIKSDGYFWRKSACTFGQTFLCMSMDYSIMDRIGNIERPHKSDNMFVVSNAGS